MTMFGLWTETLADAAKLWRTTAETLSASAYVVAKRSDVLARAAQQPTPADLAEIARLVPEKMAAFSLAQLSLLESWMAFQNGQSASLADAWDKALAPIHAQATANARRLRKRR